MTQPNPKIVVRGDSYSNLRPLFILKFASPAGGRYNLAGATIRTTYKPQPTDPNVDPNDENAPIKHEIEIDEEGVVVRSLGLELIGAASDGILHEYLTSEESIGLPLEVSLFSDVEITKGNDTITFMQSVPIKAIDGVTNRGE